LVFIKTVSETFPIIKKVEGELTKHIRQSLCQTAIFTVTFTRHLNSPDSCPNNIQISTALKLRQLSAQLFRGADGRTDMTKPTVALRNLTHPIRSNLCPVLAKHKLPTTKLGNFAEPRLLAVAVKQAKGKQSNTAIAMACEPRLVEK
jgi:hypothetical protein